MSNETFRFSSRKGRSILPRLTVFIWGFILDTGACMLSCVNVYIVCSNSLSVAIMHSYYAQYHELSNEVWCLYNYNIDS